MGIKIIAKNKRAGFDFFLLEKVEAGLVLTGTEIKSLRLGKASIAESFVNIDPEGEAYLVNASIPPYALGTHANHEEKRKRKLLLHHHQIKKIKERMKGEGLTVVPLELYFKESLVKIEIALAKGKRSHDKREVQAKKDADRDIQRAMRR